MKSAEEVLKAIKNMKNDERCKLLNELYNEYYNKENVTEGEIELE